MRQSICCKQHSALLILPSSTSHSIYFTSHHEQRCTCNKSQSSVTSIRFSPTHNALSQKVTSRNISVFSRKNVTLVSSSKNHLGIMSEIIHCCKRYSIGYHLAMTMSYTKKITNTNTITKSFKDTTYTIFFKSIRFNDMTQCFLVSM